MEVTPEVGDLILVAGGLFVVVSAEDCQWTNRLKARLTHSNSIEDVSVQNISAIFKPAARV